MCTLVVVSIAVIIIHSDFVSFFRPAQALFVSHRFRPLFLTMGQKPNPQQRAHRRFIKSQAMESKAVKHQDKEVVKPTKSKAVKMQQLQREVQEAVAAVAKMNSFIDTNMTDAKDEEALKSEDEDDDTDLLHRGSEANYTDLPQDDVPHMVPKHGRTSMKSLSHRMAAFLRHTAFVEGMCDEDDWVPLDMALRHLNCTEAQVQKTVRQSERNDAWGNAVPRFEMWISGKSRWIKATEGEYYRQRAQTMHL